MKGVVEERGDEPRSPVSVVYDENCSKQRN